MGQRLILREYPQEGKLRCHPKVRNS
ncbi:rCG42620 [Rattus norvegicus]|uniref:RCG42620 n=1 Tax=Rattus norvegicus TaxID=10116 RepID=A6K178_RAT|nr:rCG42620 [Rattus norvegicus]